MESGILNQLRRNRVSWMGDQNWGAGNTFAGAEMIVARRCGNDVIISWGDTTTAGIALNVGRSIVVLLLPLGTTRDRHQGDADTGQKNNSLHQTALLETTVRSTKQVCLTSGKRRRKIGLLRLMVVVDIAVRQKSLAERRA